jgi:hypothetical protein
VTRDTSSDGAARTPAKPRVGGGGPQAAILRQLSAHSRQSLTHACMSPTRQAGDDNDETDAVAIQRERNADPEPATRERVMYWTQTALICQAIRETRVVQFIYGQKVRTLDL